MIVRFISIQMPIESNVDKLEQVAQLEADLRLGTHILRAVRIKEVG